MAETTADVRRDIEMTRERMSTTLAQLEQKLNVTQIVRDNPWPALALAFGAGVALSGSRSDVKAAAATVAATRGASSRLGTVLDDAVATVMTGLNDAFHSRLDMWVNELKGSIGAPPSRTGTSGTRSSAGEHFASPDRAGRPEGMGTRGSWSPQSANDEGSGRGD